ncbi:hypothetical protein DFQ27_001791 [Actinomortierella ambigua]|uniref:Uncharacterized protein n=1 Tax=Actinomortierella ambigua TaxID=1343610 RepID=A0A9P6QC41_9FUNG|nr:hypothetical protein DFQ27_001791 [Actinomortierella ambigua]
MAVKCNWHLQLFEVDTDPGPRNQCTEIDWVTGPHTEWGFREPWFNPTIDDSECFQADTLCENYQKGFRHILTRDDKMLKSVTMGFCNGLKCACGGVIQGESEDLLICKDPQELLDCTGVRVKEDQRGI